MTRIFDVLVLGAGAAGMMAAIEAGKRGRSVLVVDHAGASGEKIRISGGNHYLHQPQCHEPPRPRTVRPPIPNSRCRH